MHETQVARIKVHKMFENDHRVDAKLVDLLHTGEQLL
jgi:hypothetical protein